MKSIAIAATISLVSARGCPKVNTVQNFDSDAYLGTWYEAYRSVKCPFESGECVTADYSVAEDEGFLDVYNSQQLYKSDGTLKISRHGAKGWAKQLNPELNQGTLGVKFSVFQPVYGNYDILDTDYENYTVVYSCFSTLFGYYKQEYAWLLTRVPVNDSNAATS